MSEHELIGIPLREHKDMSFSEALSYLRFGGKVSRPAWESEKAHIEIQFKTSLGYPVIFFVRYPIEENMTRVPWVPYQQDLLADDWMTIDNVKI